MPGWFDSHCHFDFPIFDTDREPIWQHSQNLGIDGLLLPGVSRQQLERLPALVAHKPWYFAAGLHPYFLDQHQADDLDWLADWLVVQQAVQQTGQQTAGQASKLVAVGECGLHQLRQASDEQARQQLQLFEAQVTLAREHNLPLVLHGVGTHDQIVATLRRLRCHTGGVIHGFSGSEQQARRYLDAGIRIGVGATFFHARATRLRRTLSALPVDAFLLETDSPDMTAPFWNSSRHSPQTIPLIGVGLSSLLKCSPEQLRIQLRHNLYATFSALES